MMTEQMRTETRIGPRSVCIQKRCMQCGHTEKYGSGAPYDARYDPEYSDFDPENDDLPEPDVW